MRERYGRSSHRRSRATRWTRQTLLALAATVVAAGTLDAQVTPVGQRGRTPAKRLSAPPPVAGNVCAELEWQPSPLVQAPEGLALLRLKRQLESAALTLEQRQQLERDQLQRIAQVRRGMDSLMQVVVRVARDNAEERAIEQSTAFRGVPDGRRMIVTIDGGDGPVTVNMEAMMRGLLPLGGGALDSTIALMAPQVDRVIRRLQPQVARLSEVAEASLPSGVAAPSGYMGLSLSGAQIRLVTPDGVLTSHCEYPLVETVDAGSPAARAGIGQGDTLVAYNGRDVTQAAVNYAELITAGNTVTVRVRRAGRPRDIPVLVSPRRSEAMTPPVSVTMRRLSDGPAPSSGMFSPSGVTVLAGAQFATMDDDFAQSLGLESGVLVLRVPGGTPAAEAGLKAGEVVRAVNGVAVRDVAALRRAVAATRDARLTVQARGGATRTVVLGGR